MKILDSYDTMKMHMLRERSNTRTGRGSLLCKIDPINTKPDVEVFIQVEMPDAYALDAELEFISRPDSRSSIVPIEEV